MYDGIVADICSIVFVPSSRDLFAKGIPCMLPQMILRGEAFSKQTHSEFNNIDTIPEFWNFLLFFPAVREYFLSYLG